MEKAQIKNEQQKDGRWLAQYINPKDIAVNGIGQFGKTAFEAEINLQILLNTVKKKMLSTSVSILIGSD